MATNSETRNIEENYADSDPKLRRVLSSGIIGLVDNTIYSPSEANRNSVAPDYLTFSTAGLSNGLASKINGIENFVAYNPYIHHTTVGAISSALAGAGINNVDGGVTKIEVMYNLVLASTRFELYTRQYRGY